MSVNNNQSETKPVDVYSLVTDRIIELLEAGTVPWRKPWTDAGIPMNAISKRPYRGIDTMPPTHCVVGFYIANFNDTLHVFIYPQPELVLFF